MKKLLSLLLALSLALSLCACGGSAGSTSAPVASDDAPAADTSSAAPTEEKTEAPAAGYLTYDDLTNTESFWLQTDAGEVKLQCDYPSGFSFDTHGTGMGSENDTAFSIVMAHAEQPMPDASLEDAFCALLNGDFHSVLRQVYSGSYGEAAPEPETVTLDCGREAIRFSGIQPIDDYGTPIDAPIWGYGMLLDGIPVIVCYVVFKEEAVAEDRLTELAHYVEEMANTVRIAA